MNTNDDELEIQHRTLIEEEGLDVAELPNDIKNAMRKFNAKLEEYEESGDAELFFELQQDDVAIADNILTFIEDNEAEYEDDEEDDEEDEEDEEDEDEEEAEEDDEEDDDDVNQYQSKTPQAQTQAQTVSTIEAKVRSLVKDGKISVNELQNIIGREPDYPSEQIGNLILKKQYLKPFYEVYQK